MGNQTPRVRSVPNYLVSAADEVVDLMAGLGVPLDPWQASVVRDGLGQNPAPDMSGYEWAADQCGCWVPRQNGKGNIILALELGWMFLFKERLIVHSAHEYKTAQEAFLRIKQVVQGSPDLDSRVNRYWQANGEQGIELKRSAGGARLRFMARTGGAGRGFSAGKVVLDEAQELVEAQMRAIMPVLSAQPNWQLWFFGTPPQPDTPGGTVSSAWIYNLKEAGEAGAARTAWWDWGIETLDLQDRASIVKLRDPRTWAAANPAAGRRILKRTIENELTLMKPGQGFAMERCGMWLPRALVEGEHTIDPQKWEAAAYEVERPEDVAIAFHVNARRTHHTIMFAGMVDGLWRVGIVRHKRGTDGLAEKLAEIKEEWNPVAFTVDAKSETIIDDLADRGIKESESAENPRRGELILPTMADVATAYGLFVDSANNELLRHHDETPLNNAIAAPPRPLAGGSTWDHRRGIEVGPAIGAGLAMWAYRERIDKVKTDYDPLANIW